MINTLLTVDAQLAATFYNYLSTDSAVLFFNTITNNTLTNIVFICFVGIMLYYYKQKGLILIFISSLAATGGLQQLLSFFFARPRPFITFLERPYLGTVVPGGFSFPSGHATIAFFIAYFLIFALNPSRYFKICIYLLAFLVAFSRVYLGAHYPLDVFFGSLLGLSGGRVSFYIVKRYLTKS